MTQMKKNGYLQVYLYITFCFIAYFAKTLTFFGSTFEVNEFMGKIQVKY